MRNSLFVILIVLLTVLFLLPGLCIEGAKTGLLLWFYNVLPALFPFFVVSRMILKLNICPKALKPYYPVIIGLISGCPTGVYILSEMVNDGQISRKKAEAMLILCGNISPAFLINYIGMQCLPETFNRYAVFICVIISSIAIFIVANLRNYIKSSGSHNPQKNNNIKDTYNTDETENFVSCLESTILKSAEIIVLIGGYIILFSIMANVIIHKFPNGPACTLIGSIPELTVGASLLSKASFITEVYIKSAAIATLCGFGGLSAIMQTIVPIREAGMSAGKYILLKIMSGIISGIIFYVYIINI